MEERRMRMRGRRVQENKFSARSNTFHLIESDPALASFDAWYKRFLRCSKEMFDRIVDRVALKWDAVNSPIDRKFRPFLHVYHYTFWYYFKIL
jgi:hypothetical protein